MTIDLTKNVFQGTVVIYNLKTDESDPVTAFAVDWIKAFSEIACKIIVFSTHTGKYLVPENVKVYEIGGGSTKQRIYGALKLIKSLFFVLNLTGNKVIFHHMSEKTACILGLIYRSTGIKQGLWYSHTHKSKTLSAATKFVDLVFTPTSNSFPVNSKKIRAIGHGVSVIKFQKCERLSPTRDGILSLGRISKIKNLEKIIDAVSNSKFPRHELTFMGPVMEDTSYVESLKTHAIQSNVDLKIINALAYSEIPQALSRFSMVYSGSPNTLDKSVVEAAAAGCFILSENKFVLELTGMKKIWDTIGISTPLVLDQQIDLLRGYEFDSELRTLISKTCGDNNNVSNTTKKILNALVSDET